MKKIASLLVLFSILFPVCKGEKVKEEFFEYKKEWKNDPKKKMKLHRVEVDDKYFEFMLPEDMIKISRASEKYSGEPIESIYSYISESDKYNKFYLIKYQYSEWYNGRYHTDTFVIKDAAKARFYNYYCSHSMSLNNHEYSSYIIEKGLVDGYAYFIDISNSLRRRNYLSLSLDTIRTQISKTIATDSTLYVFIYDTDDYIYEVPLEEKLAVMKSIRIISKEEAKAEEEKNTAGKIKFLISMLALLFLVCIGSKLNNRK